MKIQKAFFFILFISLITVQVTIYGQGNTSNKALNTEAINTMYVPYVDVCLWPPFDISNVDSTGICLYTCAFIVDDQFEAGANPCWGGFAVYDMTYYQEQIAGLRDNGGDVIISFGGASGHPLAFVAADEFELRDTYKLVIDSYSAQSIDFDIEGMFVAHPESIERRSKAMKLLLDEYPELQISLTLPVMPWGLTPDGVNVVTNAVNHDVDFSILNLMAMDYGGPGDMGDNAISALENSFDQLKNIYQGAGIQKPDSVIWATLGVCPMIGQNDVLEEIFYLDDAVDVRDFAFENEIGRISMWSANRDRQCENSWDPLYMCSHIDQEEFEFSYIFQQNGTIDYCNINTGEILPEVTSSINVYPNPAGNYLMISGCSGAEVTITSLDGKRLRSIAVSNNNYYVDMSGISNGTYIMHINLNNEITYERIIILK